MNKTKKIKNIDMVIISVLFISISIIIELGIRFKNIEYEHTKILYQILMGIISTIIIFSFSHTIYIFNNSKIIKKIKNFLNDDYK